MGGWWREWRVVVVVDLVCIVSLRGAAVAPLPLAAAIASTAVGWRAVRAVVVVGWRWRWRERLRWVVVAVAVAEWSLVAVGAVGRRAVAAVAEAVAVRA